MENENIDTLKQKMELEMEISSVAQASFMIGDVIRNRAKSADKIEDFAPKEYDGDVGESLNVLINDGKTRAEDVLKSASIKSEEESNREKANDEEDIEK